MTILITQNSFDPSQNFVGHLLEAIFCLVLKREIIIDILSEATFFAFPLLTRTRINPLIRKINTVLCCSFAKFLDPPSPIDPLAEFTDWS